MPIALGTPENLVCPTKISFEYDMYSKVVIYTIAINYIFIFTILGGGDK